MQQIYMSTGDSAKPKVLEKKLGLDFGFAE
jgi:hypothetical protein